MDIEEFVSEFIKRTEGCDEELIEGFKSFVESRITLFKKDFNINVDNDFIRNKLRQRLERIYSYSLGYKKQLLIPDQNNEELYRINNYIFEMAKSKYLGSLSVR